MKTAELRTKTTDELNKELLALSREQFNLKMQKGSGQPIKADRFKDIRSNIARIKTILNEQGLKV